MPIYDVSSYQIFCVMTLKELSEPPVRASEEDLKTIYVNGVSEAICRMKNLLSAIWHFCSYLF